MFQDATRRRPRPNDPCWCGSGRKYKVCHGPKDRLAAIAGGTAAPVDADAPGLVRLGTVSPMLAVPDHIPRPDYAARGKPKGPKPRRLAKTAAEIERMRAACAAARRVLDTTCAAARPGVTTDELDRIAHEAYLAEGGYPSTLNYHGYPKSICTSVNEVICHGIPDDRPLADGDTVNIDVTIYLDGMHGDCSHTVLIGEVDPTSRKLVEVTHACMMRGIGAVRAGGRVRDIGRAIEELAGQHGYGVVQAFVGHGIGPVFHMDPQVPHYYDPKATMLLVPGMTFTVEPMVNLGTWRHESLPDGWTAVTQDRKRSAQFEHTILVREDGVEILTLAPDHPQPFLPGGSES